MNEELKLVNCGCGGEAKVRDYSRFGGAFILVECERCGMQTDFYNTETEAITAWNRAMGAHKVNELLEHIWRDKLDTREKIANLVERMLR